MPQVDKQCQGNGATHHHACKCREEFFARMEKALEAVINQDRTRGFPNGSEWMTLILKVNAALKSEGN